jgi:isoleucyl-tRNA synthetase
VLEAQRVEGLVKGSLQANIQLFAGPEIYQSLAKLGDELRFVTITSKAQLMPLQQVSGNAQDSTLEQLKIVVDRATAEKCVRCWHFIDDVGSHQEHPQICGRCIENISTEGEVRHYA